MANVYPKGANKVPLLIVVALLVSATTVIAGIWYYGTPKYSDVGYAPVQPVNYSHYLHVEQLGMDCRYCHTYVDRSGHANVPAASTCMNCHSQVYANDPRLEPIRTSYETGEPVPWVKIHSVPDYVYFNHAVHVNRGISCYHCHGNINEMEVVYRTESLSMAFCLECHRNPEEFIRPNEEVYDLNFHYADAQAQIEEGTEFVHEWMVNPPQSCSGCHR